MFGFKQVKIDKLEKQVRTLQRVVDDLQNQKDYEWARAQKAEYALAQIMDSKPKSKPDVWLAARLELASSLTLGGLVAEVALKEAAVIYPVPA